MQAIITDVHYRMSLALVRDLGQAGVQVVTCERTSLKDNPSFPPLGGLSKYAARHVWLSDSTYLEDLLALCTEVSAAGDQPALLPVGASTLSALAAHRDDFTGACGMCIPTTEQLDLFNDKEAVHRLAEELGVPVPGELVPSDDETPEALAARAAMPCVIKPRCGEKLGLAARDRYVVARSPEEARAACVRFRSLAGELPLVQECLPGAGLGCSVLAKDGQVLVSICHQRIREYPITGGPSTCCMCVPRPDLEEFVRRMVNHTGYTGLAMFEFKDDADGNPRLLEVNPRVWGTFPLTRVSRSGLPMLWYKAAMAQAGGQMPAAANKPTPCRMTFAVSDCMAALSSLKNGRPKKAMSAFADLVNPAVKDGVFEWNDSRPGFAYLRALLAKER